jgi:hypothetical protein
MNAHSHPIAVHLEVAPKRTFAMARDWPGWCRSGRDAASALDTLLQYAPRYAAALYRAGLAFHLPDHLSAFVVESQIVGNAATEFGVPDRAFPEDALPVDESELERFEHILAGCWAAFDASVQAAEGRVLRKGPRGGGRDLEKIVQHVQEATVGYLVSFGGKKPVPPSTQDMGYLRAVVVETLAGRVRGEIPATGARGGLRWSPRYFVRRLAWHDLDHAWEIEDRLE